MSFRRRLTKVKSCACIMCQRLLVLHQLRGITEPAAFRAPLLLVDEIGSRSFLRRSSIGDATLARGRLLPPRKRLRWPFSIFGNPVLRRKRTRFVFTFQIPQPVTEIFDALGEIAHHIGNLAPPEEQEHHGRDDQKMPNAE